VSSNRETRCARRKKNKGDENMPYLQLDLPRMSVLERSLHFGPGTSVTSPLRWKGRKSGFRAFLLLLTLDTCPQSRPWECGNPKGISKECGKGGKPASWLSILSIFCHFHGLLWNACSKSGVTENPVSRELQIGYKHQPVSFYSIATA
jgi:hypothetical protein